MTEEVVIKVENVSKDFKLPHLRPNTVKSALLSLIGAGAKSSKEAQHALRGISFEVKKGEFFGIVGRNGSGKSTMLKMLAGIYQPTNGKIRLEGRLVPFIELGVGFNPELTGRDNVYLNGAILGFSEKEIDEMYSSIVEFSELERFMDQKLKNYSSGMQVRLAFSMAIRAKADVLLIDEVLAVGDADFQRKCFDYFRSLKMSETTVIFISHDMDAIRSFCDRAILIDQGKIKKAGTPDAVAVEYLKQFNKNDQDSEQSQEKERWGNGNIRIDSVKVAKDNKKRGDYNILLRATAKTTIDNPVFGFSIKNALDKELLGTNTELCGERIGQIHKGQTMEISWWLPDIFGDGTFFVGATAHHKAASPVYDWWEHAVTFKIKEGRHSFFPVTPDFKISVKVAKA